MLRARTTKHSCMLAWAWVAISSIPTKQGFRVGYAPMRNQPVSVSKAKKAITDYKKAIGRPEGLAELSIFYCEEAFSFLESCGMEDESYFAALIRMYDQSLKFVLNLPPAERGTYPERLDKLR